MSDHPGGAPPNPFLKPSVESASLFGGMIPATSTHAPKTTQSLTDKKEISSLFGGTFTAASSEAVDKCKSSLFGGSTTVSTARSSIFGAGNSLNVTTGSSSFRLLTGPNSTSVQAQTASLGSAISTSSSLTFPASASVFGSISSIVTTSQSTGFSIPSQQSVNTRSPFVFRRVSKGDETPDKPENEESNAVKNVHSLFGIDYNAATTKPNVTTGFIPTKAQEQNVSSSNQSTAVFDGGANLFGGYRQPCMSGSSTSSFSANPFTSSGTIPFDNSEQSSPTLLPSSSMKPMSGPLSKNLSASDVTSSGINDVSTFGNSGFQFKNTTSVSSSLFTVNPFAKPSYTSSNLNEKPVEKFVCSSAQAQKDSAPNEIRPIATYDDIFGLDAPANSTNEKQAPSAEKIEPTAIIAINVPSAYLNRKILMNHFSKFGQVTRISLHTTADQAQINFVDHESAALAKKQGLILHPNLPPLRIFFAAAVRPRPEDSQARARRNSAMKLLRQSSADHLEKPQKISLIRKHSKDSSNLSFTSSKKAVVNRLTLKSRVLGDDAQGKKSKSTSTAASPEKLQTLTAKDLASLKLMKALSSADKYSILESRDKLLRKQMKKEVDVRKAKYLSATCPDMCPEKERYMREVQFDLSPYELTSDRRVNHSCAVKKFSRSSADKNEPLPHELRSGNVLVLTMNYLMCSIMTELDSEEADMDLCYNYLWDRTRAMRGDIMQQHLIDQSAVYVLERCVRFHILCSERLCLEPADVFDPKMNMEHLIKSLHSLKELYHDLSESGVYLESEPEFRSYDILLNIDDGNIMFAYLLFRDDVRKSPEVQFSISVLHAVQSNNFVRFFALVRKASFLQTCILHRYFNRIRAKAFGIMVKAFSSSSSRAQSLSVAKLVHLLGFENEQKACSFASRHGLVERDGARLILDRNNFMVDADPPHCVTRAFHVSDGKRIGGAAQIINKGPLPENPVYSHVVSDSFSADGYLTDSAIALLHQKATDDCSHKQASNTDSVEECLSDDRSTDSNHLEIDYLPQDVSEFQERQNLKILRKCFDGWRTATSEAADLRRVCGIIRRSAAAELIGQWRLKTDLKMRNASVDNFRDFSIMKRYFTCWKQFCVHSKQMRVIRRSVIARKYLSFWLQITHRSIHRRHLKEMLCEVKGRLVKATLVSCIRKWRQCVCTSKTTAIVTANRHLFLMRKYSRLWQQFIRKRKWQQKKLHEGFPASSSGLSLKEQNHAWKFHCSNIKRSFRDLQETEQDLEVKRQKLELARTLSNEICGAPLPVKSYFQRYIDSKNVPAKLKPRSFTVVFCLNDNLDQFVVRWLRSKFNPVDSTKIIPINCSYNLTSSLTGLSHAIQIIESTFSLIEKLHAVSCIIFIDDEQTKQMGTPQKKISRRCSTFSIVLNRKLCLTPTTSVRLMNILIERFKNIGMLTDVATCSLRHLVTTFVSHHVLDVAVRIERLRCQLGYAPLPAAAYVSLLAGAVDCLRNAISNRSLLGFEWTIQSTLSPSPCQLVMDEHLIESSIASLEKCTLPAVTHRDFRSWSAACDFVTEYVKYATGDDENYQRSLIQEALWLLESAKQRALSEKLSTEHDEFVNELLLPWKDICCMLIAYKVNNVPEYNIAYCVTDVDGYVCNNDWFLPYWQPSYAVPALLPSYRRNVLAPASAGFEIHSSKKSKSQLVAAIVREKETNDKLEENLKSLLDESIPSLSNLFDEDEQVDIVPERDSEPSLLDSIANEKAKFAALETRLLQQC